MLLSELLESPLKRTKQIKTVKVRKVRDLLSGGECFETLTGKKVYIKLDGKWFTVMGRTPLNYNFIILSHQKDILSRFKPLQE